MEPSPSADPTPDGLAEADVDLLFVLADRAVRAGLAGEAPPGVDEDRLPESLRSRRGVFVTLEVDGQLNGCVGSLDPTAPLGQVVPRLAWEAAFSDFRLPALTPAGYDRLGVKLSLLSPLVPVAAAGEDDAVGAIRPGIDGVVIAAGRQRATFLPAVWKSLADPRDFLHHLERKAGLDPGEWSPTMRVWRYTATEHARGIEEIRRLAERDPSAAA